MNVTRQKNGSYVVSDLAKDDTLFSEVYYGYTKKDSIRMFRRAIREYNESVFINEE